MKAIGREKELGWLATSSRFSRLLAVTGARGLGKRTLVKTWLDDLGQPLGQNFDGRAESRGFDWFGIQAQGTLRESLLARLPKSEHDRVRSDEDALAQLREAWIANRSQAPAVVVWENAHHLPTETRKLLVRFLKSDPRFPVQVLLSEISLEPDFGSEMLELALKPLDAVATRELLASFGQPADSTAVERALAATAGVPLLLQLHLQSPDSSHRYWTRALAEASPAVRDAFTLLARSDAELALEELAQFVGLAPATLATELEARHVARVSPHDLARITATPPAAAAWLKGLGSAELVEADTRLARFRLASGGTSHLARLDSALAAGMFTEAAELIEDDFLASLEKAEPKDLRATLARLRPLWSNGAVATEPMARLWRLQLRLLGALNERFEARTLAGKLAKRRDLDLARHPRLALDVSWALTRAEDLEAVRALAATLEPHFTGADLAALRIEMAEAATSLEKRASLLELARDEARAALDLPAVDNDAATEARWNWVLATAGFQIARLDGMAGRVDRARAGYYDAARRFERLGRFYQASVAELNGTWISLKNRDWARLEEELQTHFVAKTALLNPYVASGYHLIQARKSRHLLRFSEALHWVETGTRKLPAEAPVAARFDLSSERVRVLLDLGLRSKACECWAEIRRSIPQGAAALPGPLAATWNGLEIEIASLTEPPLALRTRSAAMQFERGDLFQPLLRTFGAPSDDNRVALGDVTGMSPLEEITWREIFAAEAWGADLRDQALFQLQQIAALLDQSPEPSVVKCALQLVSAGLELGVTERKIRLRRLEDDLARLACDFATRLPLEIWLNALKTNENPADSPLVAKLSALDRWRWQSWWQAQAQLRETKGGPKAKAYEIISEHGSRPASVPRPARDLGAGLFISELHGEVVYKGVALAELKSKRVLKRLLVVLLEAGAQGLSKEELCLALWGENYNPMVHDARIYTSIVRLRRLLDDGRAEVVQTTDRGYACRPAFPWEILRLASRQNKWNNRLQNLILYAFEDGRARTKYQLSRAEIAPFVKTSEANLKRELRKLVEKNMLRRAGSGRNVVYSRI